MSKRTIIILLAVLGLFVAWKKGLLNGLLRKIGITPTNAREYTTANKQENAEIDKLISEGKDVFR